MNSNPLHGLVQTVGSVTVSSYRSVSASTRVTGNQGEHSTTHWSPMTDEDRTPTPEWSFTDMQFHIRGDLGSLDGGDIQMIFQMEREIGCQDDRIRPRVGAARKQHREAHPPRGARQPLGQQPRS